MEKKLDKNTALAKISAMISKYYENLGRTIIEDTEETKQELIEKIDALLNKTDIPTKNLIIEKLGLDDEIKEELKDKWKT